MSVFPSQGHIKSVAVFCGARLSNNPLYQRHADELGCFLAGQGYEIVYGGGRPGLMGVVAHAALRAGGTVHGVNMPIFNRKQGISPEGIQEIMEQTVFARKARMLNLVQAAVVLPGGIGTLDEALDALAEDDLMEHALPEGIIKPVIFVNSARRFDPIFQYVEQSRREELTSEIVDRFYDAVPDPYHAIEMLNDLNLQGPVPVSSQHSGIFIPHTPLWHKWNALLAAQVTHVNKQPVSSPF